MQVFTVTGLFAGQHNTKLHGTITGVILREMLRIIKNVLSGSSILTAKGA